MMSPNEIQVIYPLKKFAGNLARETHESIFREISTYSWLNRRNVSCCRRPVNIYKNNDLIVFTHQKLRYKLKWLMPKKDLLQKHGIAIMRMLLVQVKAINDNGF
jgi:hypothetical protein